MRSAADRLSAALSGRYRIERELGAGGMATVFLAHDEKHDRKVAIKVLKPELAAVLGAERFVVEIKTTAALSHPHILPLFDSGTADGFLYYVMPFIEGETIREKLNRETQFGVEEAVRIAREVADALDYAHRHGVIHRDIKPENILLHDGRAMVMDFGIALAVSAAAGGRMTETGLSLGTPHYMSPEQATAEKEITPRSDVYSLASVLYEMLAGEPPHTAGSAQAVIMKIITEQAPPVSSLRKSVPPNVTAALAKALEKLPADRFDSAKAFADALGNAAFTAPSVVDQRTAARVAAGTRWGYATVAFAATATAVAIWALARGPRASEEPVIRMALEHAPGAHIYALGSNGNSVAISPRGDRIVYAAEDSGGVRTFVRGLADLKATPIAGQFVADPSFAPDGRSIAFSFGPDLYRVPAAGGSPVKVADGAGTGIRGIAWLGPDTLILGSLTGLHVVRADGGQIARLPGADTIVTAISPFVLPGGRLIAYARGRVLTRQLTLLGVDDHRTTSLDIPVAAPIGYRDGHLIFVTPDGVLMAIPFDISRRRATGAAVQLETGIRLSPAGAVFASLSGNGTLWYIAGSANTRLALTSRSGSLTFLRDAPLPYRYPRISPDGRKVAVTVGAAPSSDVWVFDRQDRTFERITTSGTASVPEWTPDGRRIVYREFDGGRNDVWWRSADGSGQAEKLYDGEPINEAVVSPDGNWLVLRTQPTSRFKRDILARRMKGDTALQLLVGGPAQESHPRISPDGKWLAYESNESGRFQVFVRPFMREGWRKQVSTDGGTEPVWSRSGSELFYRTPGAIVAVGIRAGATIELGERRSIPAANAADDATHQNYDVMPDGTILTIVQTDVATSGVLVYNWARELKRKLSGSEAP